jgi:hypothetical protein
MRGAPDHGTSNLLAALASGQVYTGELGSYRGLLDLNVDKEVAMGAVSVRPDLNSRQLTVVATGIPSNGTVEIVQGRVDYAGTAEPNPPPSAITSLPSAAFASGAAATVIISTTKGSFVRAAVQDASDTRIAVSNPIWLLREAPPTRIPAARATHGA